ncbi:hypothetical protein OIU78_004804 [Salix suchowensis]|nr:hypothetical protein OIU78_004804 [Salix suchowensis]
MGIDPNNHRLNQNLLRSRNPPKPAIATPSGLKVQAIQPPAKPLVDSEQTSDAGSRLDDDQGALPDLNLDLTMSIPSSSIAHVEGNHPKDNESNFLRSQQIAPSSSLLLSQ